MAGPRKATLRLSELVVISDLQSLCESFTAATGVATAILGVDGSILTATGWKDLCTRFHRIHPVAAQRCLESDTVLASQLKAGQTYNVYRCRNGLVDVAVPIVVAGEHIANFFIGQFFFEPPDRDFFVRQADEFRFDKAAYLDALDRIPIYSEEKVRSLMAFLSQLACIIGETGLARKRVEETNAQLQMYQEHLLNLINTMLEISKIEAGRVLLEEANTDLHRLLEPLGFELREASNGQQAVAMCDQWHPDLVWMDIRMLVMDGLEATRRIKGRHASHVPKIVALTAHALEEERREILAAGCDDFVRKPHREAEIFETLTRHLGTKFRYAEEPMADDEVVSPDPSRFQDLPAPWLEELHETAELLDGPRSLAVAERIGQRDRVLGEQLSRLVEELQYKRLLTLLDTALEGRTHGLETSQRSAP